MDLFQLLEQDASIIPDVMTLLQKLANPTFDSRYQEFSHQMGVPIDDIDLGFQQRKTDQVKLEDQTKHRDQLVAEVANFRQKLMAFRQDIPNASKKVATIDAEIASYEEAIKTLRLQRVSVLEKDNELK